MQYDWIQWYYLALYALNVTLGLALHGNARDRYDFRYTFISMVLALPITGRLLGWW